MIGDFLKKSNAILQNSSSSRSKIANHSARKTCISTLLDKDVNPIHVAQLSGHKNIESLKSYHCASINQQKEMSNILNSHASNHPYTSSSTVSKRPLTSEFLNVPTAQQTSSYNVEKSLFSGATMKDINISNPCLSACCC